jgi:hypothetical protein
MDCVFASNMNAGMLYKVVNINYSDGGTNGKYTRKC